MQDILYFLKKHYFKIFIVMIIYAIFLRFYNLWVQSFWIDEWFSSYATISSIQLEYLIHNISQIFSFKIFWVSDFSARFPSVIFSSLNIIVFYFLSKLFFENKKKAVISTLIFSFLTWEIIWARQARFYSLLQLLFTIDLYLLYALLKNYKVIYLNLLIIFLYIGIHFHPFLWAGVVWFLLVFIYILIFQKNSIKVNIRKYFFTIIIVLWIIWIELYFYLNTWEIKKIPEPSSRLSFEMWFTYFKNYISHLIIWTGILWIFSIFWIIVLFLKKEFKKILIFWFLYIFIFFIIAFKGFLFHTRYVFILYPIIILLALYSLYFLYEFIANKLNNKRWAKFYAIIVSLAIISTGKYTFLPQTSYYIDFTSPQPNFKEAYRNIPKNSLVISGFPMLCKWYYWNKWTCKYSLAVDFVWNKKNHKNILDRKKDNYTNIAYLNNLEKLESWKIYYFVVDNLTNGGTIKNEIIKEIYEKWTVIYESWENYNKIEVVKYEQ